MELVLYAVIVLGVLGAIFGAISQLHPRCSQ